ncbi:sigma-54-dependent Fis family transcriptional regulator, partial [Azoarcus sp. TTM-91]|uniref:helix-turn-helix domain-containing protein n=1 Tax=Azoarcus sp. TTM-91 TaxID=2691581 RepID=UPI0016BCDA3C
GDDRALPLARRLEQAERRFISEALQECGGNVATAAERLQLPKKTLYDKLARLGMHADEFRHAGG